MKIRNRWLWFGAIALLALLLFSLFFAPRASFQQGSTYSRAPNGYGAWYAYMQAQGAPIQRWQKPLKQLFQPPAHPFDDQAIPIRFSASTHPKFSPQFLPQHASIINSPTGDSPITLIQIDNGLGQVSLPRLFKGLEWSHFPGADWVKKGNNLVLLGIKTSVTAAPFSSVLSSPVGAIKIETSRRYSPEQEPSESKSQSWQAEAILSDAYGAVAWQVPLGKGRITFVTTAHLAANAYQTEPGNFDFLAQLVTEPGYPIWVDEYLHGYKDQEALAQEHTGGLAGYLAKTPLVLVAVQVGVLLLVLIWAQNHRLGPPVALADATVDNSEAYIRALAGVLQKANCSEFVVETIGKAELLRVQRSLGLGTSLLDPEIVVAAWAMQTGQPASELAEILKPTAQQRRLSERELLRWLSKLQGVRNHLLLIKL